MLTLFISPPNFTVIAAALVTRSLFKATLNVILSLVTLLILHHSILDKTSKLSFPFSNVIKPSPPAALKSTVDCTIFNEATSTASSSLQADTPIQSIANKVYNILFIITDLLFYHSYYISNLEYR